MRNKRTKKICKCVAIVGGVVLALVTGSKFLHWIEPIDEADDEDDEFCYDE